MASKFFDLNRVDGWIRDMITDGVEFAVTNNVLPDIKHVLSEFSKRFITIRGMRNFAWKDRTYNLRSGIGIGIYDKDGRLVDWCSTGATVKPIKKMQSDYLTRYKRSYKTMYTYKGEQYHMRGGSLFNRAFGGEKVSGKLAVNIKADGKKSSKRMYNPDGATFTDGFQLLKEAVQGYKSPSEGRDKNFNGFHVVLFSVVPYGWFLNEGFPNDKYAKWFNELRDDAYEMLQDTIANYINSTKK